MPLRCLRGLVEEQLERRDEPLQVGLLVDREIALAGREQLLGDRREVIAAALEPFARSLYFWIVWNTDCVLPPSTANIPL